MIPLKKLRFMNPLENLRVMNSLKIKYNHVLLPLKQNVLFKFLFNDNTKAL